MPRETTYRHDGATSPDGRKLPGSTLVGRKHMGGGEFLSRGAAPHVFRIECPHEKSHWRARDPGDQIRPVFAGTTVSIEGELFEVAEHQEPTTDRDAHLYLLSPWDDRNPIRGQCFEYSMDALRRERSDWIQSLQRDRIGSRLNWCGVVVALLPERDQLRLEEHYGFEAVFWTRWSALLFTVLLFGGGIVTLTFYMRSPVAVLALLAIAGLLIEQFFRRAQAIVGRPCGSLLGYVLRPLFKRLEG